jgi:protein with PEP-CTERM/exosortase system signal
MKAQKKNGQGLHLKTSNNRWKWMAGATAATAAGVSASQGSIITINLANNYISAFGGNHLNADLTGDGHADVTLTGAKFFLTHLSYPYPTSFLKFSVAVNINGIHAKGYDNGGYPSRYVRLGSQYRAATGPYSVSLVGSIPITFRDLHINNGKLTSGSLEVTVTPDKVQLDSLTYNTRNKVPDQGSSLALLAMGAGGVLALRRWRSAQRRC